jgi:hypothetical protein
MGKPTKKYRFRKMYFICNDNKVIDPEYQVTNAFQYEDYGKRILEQQGKRDFHYMHEDKSIPLPVKTLQGFYLVPEQLFEDILKDWTKDQ